MLLMMKEIRDLNRFFDVMKSLGYSIEEQMHTVLFDGSEVGIWRIHKDGQPVLDIVVHYIDRHYEAIKDLPPDVDDTTFLRKLIEVEQMGLWRTPIEPVLMLVYVDDVVRDIIAYSDSYPVEAEASIQHYREHGENKELMHELLERYKGMLGRLSR